MNSTDNTPKKVTTREMFETTECSRCGGSGHYSYNTMHGSMCYGCKGRGWQLIRNGSKALDAWKAAYTVTVAVRDLVAGDKVMVNDSMRGREVCCTVESSELDDINQELNPGYWMVRFSSGPIGGHGFVSGDSTLRRPASQEDKRAAYNSISHLKGAIMEAWTV